MEWDKDDETLPLNDDVGPKIGDVFESDVACPEDNVFLLANNAGLDVDEEKKVEFDRLIEGNIVACCTPEKPHLESCTYWMREAAS